MTNDLQARARKQFKTQDVSGFGGWARVSRCNGTVKARLFTTRAECDYIAARAKPCGPGCTMAHETVELELPEIAWTG